MLSRTPSCCFSVPLSHLQCSCERHPEYANVLVQSPHLQLHRCIFAELLTDGKPLFSGDRELDVLSKIFEICGTPEVNCKVRVPECHWPDGRYSFLAIPHRVPMHCCVFLVVLRAVVMMHSCAFFNDFASSMSLCLYVSVSVREAVFV